MNARVLAVQTYAEQLAMEVATAVFNNPSSTITTLDFVCLYIHMHPIDGLQV